MRSALFASLCFLFLLSSSPYSLFPQISYGGEPAGFRLNDRDKVPVIQVRAPEISGIRAVDDAFEKQGLPRRVGISIETDIDLLRDGKTEILNDGTRIWRLAVTCEGALALGLYYDNFTMVQGSRFFVYGENREQVLGAYTLYNNMPGGLFATELIPGDKVYLELNVAPGAVELPACHISELSYLYRDFPSFLEPAGTADDCEVNINCPEGDNWQYQKQGVTRIYVKSGGGYFWCTGSLLNNALQNNEPFLLTADHCGADATTEEFLQWVFYFNYEAPGCENPTITPTPNSMIGAVKLASAGTDGSDFLLLRLADTIPLYYEPYYNGWSIENIPSPFGVTIHHPMGDIKKISTYTQAIVSAPWNTTPNTHWRVYWSETETDWGVTEFGSSGSPLFNNTGQIIGALTGGQAACDPGNGTGPDKPDYYGKFSYSWDQNGSEASRQLKHWLDPNNTGISELNGKYSDLTAAFQASETVILSGNTITFESLSSGLPVFWEWTFEGGQPSSYIGIGPVDVFYANTGLYDVTLIVSDGIDSDTLHLQDYIHVVGNLYPNPSTGKVNIYLETDLPANIEAEVFNILGARVHYRKFENQIYPLISLDLSTLRSGVYTIRLQANQRFYFARVLLRKP